MKMLVECSKCLRQYDASRRKIGGRFHCHCGNIVVVREAKGHHARVVNCSSCGAARSGDADCCTYCESQFTLHERDLNTACPHCLALVSDKARFCHHCGVTLAPELSAGENTKLSCPACGSNHNLVSRRLGHERVTVLECPRCVGFWLGHEAFQQLIGKAKHDALPEGTTLDKPQKVAAKLGLPVGSTVPKSRERGWKYRPCVVCHQLMVRRNYGRDSGVILDMCRNHGIWFDAEELARILVWIRAGGEEKKPRLETTEEKQFNADIPPWYSPDPPFNGLFVGLLAFLFGPRNRPW